MENYFRIQLPTQLNKLKIFKRQFLKKILLFKKKTDDILND